MQDDNELKLDGVLEQDLDDSECTIGYTPAMSGMVYEETGSDWPRIRLKHLHMTNFGIHENVEIDFTEDGDPLKLACLVGPNGTGKTTILHAIHALFSNYEGYDPIRYRSLMTKHIRNHHLMGPAEKAKADFSLKGIFSISNGEDYEVEVTSREVVSRHPEFVSLRFKDYCFMARFDQELHTFQLRRDRWSLFQELFLAVTGYRVQEKTSVFDQSDDPEMADLLDKYVMEFNVDKPAGLIVHTQCSAGERKIAKCFSTILNKDVQPSMILIDNVTDHVELDRHLQVIKCIQRCFPTSQLIVTCHSASVQRSLDRSQLYDMRFITHSKKVVDEPWRLRIRDDLYSAYERISMTRGLHGEIRTGLADALMGKLSEALYDDIEDPKAFVKESHAQISYVYLVTMMSSLNSPPSKIIGTQAVEKELA